MWFTVSCVVISHPHLPNGTYHANPDGTLIESQADRGRYSTRIDQLPDLIRELVTQPWCDSAIVDPMR